MLLHATSLVVLLLLAPHILLTLTGSLWRSASSATCSMGVRPLPPASRPTCLRLAMSCTGWEGGVVGLGAVATCQMRQPAVCKAAAAAATNRPVAPAGCASKPWYAATVDRQQSEGGQPVVPSFPAPPWPTSSFIFIRGPFTSRVSPTCDCRAGMARLELQAKHTRRGASQCDMQRGRLATPGRLLHLFRLQPLLLPTLRWSMCWLILQAGWWQVVSSQAGELCIAHFVPARWFG